MSSHFILLPRSSMMRASSSGDHLLCFFAGLSAVGGMLRLLLPGPGPGPSDPGPLGSAGRGTEMPPPPPTKAPAGAYPPPPRKGYGPGGGCPAGAAYRVPIAGATSATCCRPPVMAAAGANAAAVAGLEVGTAASCAAAAKGGGTGLDADLARAGWLGGESEDSFESETLRSDRISTVDGVFSLSLPSGWSSSTPSVGAVVSRDVRLLPAPCSRPAPNLSTVNQGEGSQSIRWLDGTS